MQKGILMPKKKKKIVWHKRKGKFIPASALKAHHGKNKEAGSLEKDGNSKEIRLKHFAKNLSAQIKKAAQNDN